MSLFAPAYYPAFHCIAGDCQHSCCIGWEINIDPRTLARYKSLPPRERKAIFSHTATQKGCTSFKLTPDGRCPFLNRDGLCRLILTHGEEILCDICREHPRFYHTYANRTEVGLGLCCEAAAELILTAPAPFQLICIEHGMSTDAIDDPFEADFFATRKEIFAILCNRGRPLQQRIDALLHRFSLSRQTIYGMDSHWQNVYRNLERLDPAWDEALTTWENVPASVFLQDEAPIEHLIAYFLYRHLPDALDDGRLSQRIAFALLSAHVISSIAAARNDGSPIAVLIDTARAYSAEVEYDEDNVERLLNLL